TLFRSTLRTPWPARRRRIKPRVLRRKNQGRTYSPHPGSSLSQLFLYGKLTGDDLPVHFKFKNIHALREGSNFRELQVINARKYRSISLQQHLAGRVNNI